MVREAVFERPEVEEEAGRGKSLESQAISDMGAPEVHVLAVDDSVIERKIIERLLRTSAFKVTTADSGSRALEILGIGESRDSVNVNTYQFNLIITDYCMPRMSGYDLLKRIKETSALKEIPVVIMSSENVPHRIKRCLAEGAEEFILKPIQLADVRRLRGHIRQLNPVDQAGVTCTKRKGSSEGLQTQSSERRARLDCVTVP